MQPVRLTRSQAQSFNVREWGLPTGHYEGRSFIQRTRGFDDALVVFVEGRVGRLMIRTYPIEYVDEPLPCSQALPPEARAAMLAYRKRWPASCPFGSSPPAKGFRISSTARELSYAVRHRWPRPMADDCAVRGQDAQMRGTAPQAG